MISLIHVIQNIIKMNLYTKQKKLKDTELKLMDQGRGEG